MKSIFVAVCALGALAGMMAAAAPAQARSFDLPPRVVVDRLPSGTPVKAVAFSKIAIQIPYGSPFLRLSTGLLCVNNRTATWDSGAPDLEIPRANDLQAMFASVMSEAGFRTAGGASSLFEDASATAEFEVGAIVHGVREDLCYQAYNLGNSSSANGALRMDLEWQVYSRAEHRVVARLNTSGGIELKGLTDSAVQKMLAEAMRQNVIALANSAEFRAAVVGAPATPDQALRPNGLAALALTVSSNPPSIPDAIGSVVSIFTGDAMGSGFVVADGYVMTNRHVVGADARVRVHWSDGLEAFGDVVRTDPRRDVALIKVETRGRASLGVRADPVRPGDTVFAIGTPLDPKFQNTVTRGIVSADRIYDGFAYIQSDVMVNHGNSGGPLLDERARLIGITVAGYQPNGAPSGLNLFIPIRDAFDFLGLSIKPSR